ncbi:MAG: transcription repressor NadR [Pseudoflavonifractor sp.]|nr:transcription repressor NadR [Pseudoflavonifractor sp.]
MDILDGQARREKILRQLGAGSAPVSAAALARATGVSRQIIVGDVALLRAAGHPISATPRGYVKGNSSGFTRTLACVHPPQGMEAELNAIVDAGCEVVDVVVEHPLYGQLTGALRLRSRYDVGQFLAQVQKSDAKPLSDLTGGIHLHTVRSSDSSALDRAVSALRALGYLLE